MKNSKSSKAKYLQIPDEFNSIQYAVNNSNAGDIIQISRGEYQENLRIEKSITLIANSSNVIIAPKHEDQPIIDIRGDNVEVTIQGILLDGNPESTTNKKVGVSINEGSLILRECKFRNWNINLDDAPVDDDDFWENLHITGVQAGDKTNLLTTDNCKFENCDNGIHITSAKKVELTNRPLAKVNFG